MEYYSVLKRNELSSHEKTWRNLTCMLLSEANLKKLYDSNYIISWKGKTLKIVKGSVVVRG